jgi:hypothetical protein
MERDDGSAVGEIQNDQPEQTQLDMSNDISHGDKKNKAGTVKSEMV